MLLDVGVGTGIDYGDVHLVRIAGALTVVGEPVVYACRLGGAPAGRILLNQQAYEIIHSRYGDVTVIDSSSLEIKSEGRLFCYDAMLSNSEHAPDAPFSMKN